MKLEKCFFHPTSAWGGMSRGMEETTQLSADLLTSSEEYTGTYPNRSMPTPPSSAFRESQGTHIKFSGIINPDLQKTLTLTSRYFFLIFFSPLKGKKAQNEKVVNDIMEAHSKQTLKCLGLWAWHCTMELSTSLWQSENFFLTSTFKVDQEKHKESSIPNNVVVNIYFLHYLLSPLT